MKPLRASFRAFLLAVCAAFAPVAVLAQPAPLTGLDAYIEKAMKDWEVPGLSLAVIRNDTVIYERGYGVRALGKPEKVDEHTLFAIASTSKAFTVGALGMLVDERKLRWDDLVSRHMPSFELSDPLAARELTVRDLITHRSGLSRSDNIWIAAPFERDEILRRARELPLVEPFRTTYGYNNIMFIAAGEVAAAVAGKSWDDLVAERIFTPLGMTRSTSRMDVIAQRDNVAMPHTRVNGRVEASTLRDYDNIGGAGAIFSSAHEMAQWVRLQLNGGTYNGKRLIAESTIREMHSPQTIMPVPNDSTNRRLFPTNNFRAYGLGWFLMDYHGRKLVHHSGSINWTRTHVGMVPSERIGVVAIANLGSSNLQQAIMYRVIDALLGVKPTDWSAEYLAIANRGNATPAAAGAPNPNARIPNTTPSLAPEGYVGRFTNRVYGDAEVVLENGKLVLKYAPDYIGDLEHWHHDTYRLTWRRHGFGRTYVTYSLNRQGRAAALELEGFGRFERVGGGR